MMANLGVGLSSTEVSTTWQHTIEKTMSDFAKNMGIGLLCQCKEQNHPPKILIKSSAKA